MSPNEWIALIVGIISIITGILAGFLWLTRVIVRDELAKATRPIQPGYRNGGESLSDIAATVRRIAKHVALEDK